MTLAPSTILFDSSGNPVAVTPAGALASTQSALVTVGSDYAATAAARVPKVDGFGSQYMVPVSPGGASTYVYNGQTPPAAANQYGLTIHALQSLPAPAAYAPITLDPTGSVNVHEKSKATARYIVPSVAGGAAGKSMFSIFNGSAATILRIQQVNMQTPYLYATGQQLLGLGGTYNQSVAMYMEMRRITGHTKAASTVTAGYALADSNDAAMMDAGIVAYSNATITGQAANPFHRCDTNSPSGLPWYLRGDANQKTLNLRPGEGMSVTTITNTANITYEIEVVVTVALG